jgi:hypothetical protein
LAALLATAFVIFIATIIYTARGRTGSAPERPLTYLIAVVNFSRFPRIGYYDAHRDEQLWTGLQRHWSPPFINLDELIPWVALLMWQPLPGSDPPFRHELVAACPVDGDDRSAVGLPVAAEKFIPATSAAATTRLSGSPLRDRHFHRAGGALQHLILNVRAGLEQLQAWWNRRGLPKRG